MQTKLTNTQLTLDFGDAASLVTESVQKAVLFDPKLVNLREYYLTARYLLAYGIGAGKTKSVAALYIDQEKLDSIFDREGEPDEWIGDESSVSSIKQGQGVLVKKPFYLCFDTELFRMFYAREMRLKHSIFGGLGEKLTSAWKAELRTLLSHTPEELNNPKIKMQNPKIKGVWTVENIKGFREDYVQRAAVDPETQQILKDPETGETIYTDIWDPNPNANRLIVRLTKDIKISTIWGTQSAQAGGMLAIRESDVARMFIRIKSIDEGECPSTLLKWDSKNGFVSAEDLYLTDPGDLERRYNPVPLNDFTRAHQAELGRFKPSYKGLRVAAIESFNPPYKPPSQEDLDKLALSLT